MSVSFFYLYVSIASYLIPWIPTVEVSLTPTFDSAFVGFVATQNQPTTYTIRTLQTCMFIYFEKIQF